MSQPRILAFAGSSRKDSFNQKMIELAAQSARDAGAVVTVVDWAEYELPLYNGDLEASEGLPESVMRLKKLFLQHQGLLISAPEYNSSITPLLKNAIDWVSRPAPDEGNLAAYQGKVSALLSASPGALGGMRGLVHLRSILGNIGVLVVPDQFALSKAHEAFTDGGQLKDGGQQSRVAKVTKALVETVSKMHG